MELLPYTTVCKPVVSTRACNSCKKRKGKCIGNPCTYCTKKGLSCVFREGRKRGPAAKKVKVGSLPLNDIQFSLLVSDIQVSMSDLFQQGTFVDFYFQFLGQGIPLDFKLALTSPARSEALTPQLCIIYAHILRFFGNSALESQFIEEAERRVSNIFNCDTIESAVALLMMAMYLGVGHPKSYMFVSLAHNITKLHSVNTTPTIAKFHKVSHALSITFDQTTSRYERCKKFNDVLPGTPVGLTTREWTMVLTSRIHLFPLLVMNIDFELEVDVVIRSICGPPPISPEDEAYMLREIKKLEDECEANGLELGGVATNSKFVAAQMRFLVAWRSNNTQAAFEAAGEAFTLFNETGVAMALWHRGPSTQLLLLPYFFEQCGQAEKATEFLSHCVQWFTKVGKQQELLEKCVQMNLPIIQTYNITQIEQELLGDFNQSTPDTTNGSPPQELLSYSNLSPLDNTSSTNGSPQQDLLGELDSPYALDHTNSNTSPQNEQYQLGDFDIYPPTVMNVQLFLDQSGIPEILFEDLNGVW